MSWKSVLAPTVLAIGLAVLAPTSPAAADTQVAQDGFGRTVSNGLGTADTGGAWALTGTASNF